ncbi:MAG: hypothetical protein ACXADW_20770 [Candidatus Hodarchaeales archaeon]
MVGQEQGLQGWAPGWVAYESVKSSLIDKSLIQKCSCQDIINSIRSVSDLDWLTRLLDIKYGLN